MGEFRVRRGNASQLCTGWNEPQMAQRAKRNQRDLLNHEHSNYTKQNGKVARESARMIANGMPTEYTEGKWVLRRGDGRGQAGPV